MTLETKRIIIAILGATFLISLLFVQRREITRQREEAVRLVRAAVQPAFVGTAEWTVEDEGSRIVVAPPSDIPITASALGASRSIASATTSAFSHGP